MNGIAPGPHGASALCQ